MHVCMASEKLFANRFPHAALERCTQKLHPDDNPLVSS